MILSTRDVVHRAFKAHGVLDGVDPIRIPTGFPVLDDRIGGLSGEELMVLGARPNVGKSTALLYMAHTADLAGYVPGIISLEDGPITVGERVQSFMSRVPSMSLRKDGPSYANTQMVVSTLGSASKVRIRFAFPIGGTLDEVLEACEELIENGCNILYIDYLTATTLDGFGKTERSGFNKILVAIRRLGYAKGVPLVMAAQCRRPGRDPSTGGWLHEPEMQDLGETAFLEHKAEIIMLFWRNEEGLTMGKIAKLKYDRVTDTAFRVRKDPQTGLLITE